MHLFKSIVHFFSNNFPSWFLIRWLFPFSLAWSITAIGIAGYFKKQKNWKTGYTRKLFHFFIFFTAYFYQVKFGLPGVFIVGWAVTIVLVYTCLKGQGNFFYEALAREKDEPFRTRYIVYSYLATFVGGVLSNLLFGEFAVFGYAVTGIADALAEPVGTRFGRHTYRVFTFDKKLSYRSLEGSAAVFFSTIAVSAIIINSSAVFTISLPVLLLIALICTLVEAVSPGGFDNALLQITASFLFSAFVQYAR
jgi:phytol kinase